MMLDKKLKTNKIADITEYSKCSIKAIYSNIHYYRTTKAPPGSSRRPRSIIQFILEALYDHLLEKPELYLEEIAIFLQDEFEVLVSISSISKALKSVGWSKKAACRVAREQNPDLRDFYL
jgi:transposase